MKEKINTKSDIPAKTAFMNKLSIDYDSVRVISSPADIIAVKGEEEFYFEIKYTRTKENKYFGAATLTEWEAAVKYRDRYVFVVASESNENWEFKEYTPDEFMKFSTVPPFKIYFNVPVGKAESQSFRNEKKNKRKNKAVRLNHDRLEKMIGFYKKLKSSNNQR